MLHHFSDEPTTLKARIAELEAELAKRDSECPHCARKDELLRACPKHVKRSAGVLRRKLKSHRKGNNGYMATMNAELFDLAIALLNRIDKEVGNAGL
jgi:hypothetical protein